MEICKQEKVFLCLHSLYERRSSEIFRASVQYLPHYKQQIQNPICLQLIISNMKNNGYRSTSQIYYHLNLIISNCLQYNRKYNQKILPKIESICKKFRNSIETVWCALMRELRKDRDRALKINKNNQSRCKVEMNQSETTPSSYKQKDAYIIYDNFELNCTQQILKKFQKIQQRRKQKIYKKIKRLGSNEKYIIDVDQVQQLVHSSSQKITRSQVQKQYNQKNQILQIKHQNQFQHIQVKIQPLSDVKHEIPVSYVSNPSKIISSPSNSHIMCKQQRIVKSVHQESSIHYNVARKIRKLRVSIRREIQFLYNKILMKSVNLKVYNDFKVPSLLRQYILNCETCPQNLQIYNQYQNQCSQELIDLNSQRSNLNQQHNVYEKLKLVSRICEIDEEKADGFAKNCKAINASIILFKLISQYVCLHELGFQTLTLNKLGNSLKIVVGCLKQLCDQLSLGKQLEYLSKKRHIKIQGYKVVISKQFQEYIMENQDEIHQLSEQFYERLKQDEFYIKTNLILKHKKNNQQKYFTVQEIQANNQRKRTLQLKKHLQLLHQHNRFKCQPNDQDFINNSYSKKSNKMIISKYPSSKLQINWDIAKGIHKMGIINIPYGNEQQQPYISL